MIFVAEFDDVKGMNVYVNELGMGLLHCVIHVMEDKVICCFDGFWFAAQMGSPCIRIYL